MQNQNAKAIFDRIGKPALALASAPWQSANEMRLGVSKQSRHCGVMLTTSASLVSEDVCCALYQRQALGNWHHLAQSIALLAGVATLTRRDAG